MTNEKPTQTQPSTHPGRFQVELDTRLNQLEQALFDVLLSWSPDESPNQAITIEGVRRVHPGTSLHRTVAYLLIASGYAHQPYPDGSDPLAAEEWVAHDTLFTTFFPDYYSNVQKQVDGAEYVESDFLPSILAIRNFLSSQVSSL